MTRSATAAARWLLFSALFAAALAQPTNEPSDDERGQQKRDDHTIAVPPSMVITPVGGLHQCLDTVSRADRLTGSNALNCFNGQIRLTRPPCHVDLKSLPPPAADPPGEQPQVKQAQAAAFFEPEIDHFVMAITAAEATVRHTTFHRTP